MVVEEQCREDDTEKEYRDDNLGRRSLHRKNGSNQEHDENDGVHCLPFRR